ncbi:MAG: response regulator [Candidatus Kapabacteria bacterium]|nr:response regulator [Candidatus Kapabacteria bacterium]
MPNHIIYILSLFINRIIFYNSVFSLNKNDRLNVILELININSMEIPMAVRILCVDDEVNQRSLISYTLLKEGYNVKVAKDGKEALNTIKESIELEYNPFELILLDINMPKMDGFEVVENLKSDNLTKNIPIIFVSSSLDQEATNKAIKMGVDDFIYKPFNPKEIYSRISKQLNKKTFENSMKNISLEDSLNLEFYKNLSTTSFYMNEQTRNEFYSKPQKDNRAAEILNEIEYNLTIQERVLDDLNIHTNENINFNKRTQSIKVNHLIQKYIQTFNIKNDSNLNLIFNKNECELNTNSAIFNTMLGYIFNLVKLSNRESKIEIDVYNFDSLIKIEIYYSMKIGLFVKPLIKNNVDLNCKEVKSNILSSSEFILAKTLVHSLGGDLVMKNCLEDICLLQINIPKNLIIQ